MCTLIINTCDPNHNLASIYKEVAKLPNDRPSMAGTQCFIGAAVLVVFTSAGIATKAFSNVVNTALRKAYLPQIHFGTKAFDNDTCIRGASLIALLATLALIKSVAKLERMATEPTEKERALAMLQFLQSLNGKLQLIGKDVNNQQNSEAIFLRFHLVQKTLKQLGIQSKTVHHLFFQRLNTYLNQDPTPWRAVQLLKTFYSWQTQFAILQQHKLKITPSLHKNYQASSTSSA